jgi:hypothetical protein
MFGYDFFLHLDCDSDHFFFHFAIIILLWSHGFLFNNILKNTKHNEIQEKARRIQAGTCAEPKLTSNRHSRADTLSLSPIAVAGLRVRHPRRFLLGKFVREPNCS